MEYGYKKVNKSLHASCVCPNCGEDQFNIQGIIRYAFIFIESLPCFPLSKSLKISCNGCKSSFQADHFSLAKQKQIKKLVFTPLVNIHLYSMCFLVFFAACYWYVQHQESKLQLQTLVATPQVNDFYYVDYRKLTANLRPHQKYRIARVVDVTDNLVTVIYSRYFYRFQGNLDSSLYAGHVSDMSFFSLKAYHYSKEQLALLLKNDTIYKVERPERNVLNGHYIADISPKVAQHIAKYQLPEATNKLALTSQNASFSQRLSNLD